MNPNVKYGIASVVGMIVGPLTFKLMGGLLTDPLMMVIVPVSGLLANIIVHELSNMKCN